MTKEHCKNCQKKYIEHHIDKSILGTFARCKIEDVKTYYNLDHWTGQTIEEMFAKNLVEGGRVCTCNLGYDCWDHHYRYKKSLKNKELFYKIFNTSIPKHKALEIYKLVVVHFQ